MDFEIFGKYIAGFLAVLMTLVLPLKYIAQSQVEIIDDYVNLYTNEFTDAARQEGRITKAMYEEYIAHMDSTGELYDINIEVAHPVTGKEIADASLGEEIPSLIAEKTSYAAPNGNSVNESKDAVNEIFSLATHTHTEACYAEAASLAFNYTGTVQTFTAPESGTYIFSVWGAQGYSDYGGYGGYATGSYELTQGQTVYVYVGGQGAHLAGGWNGGGTLTWAYPDCSFNGSGGGGTDIRVGGTSLYDRKIVAGGGGGAGFFYYLMMAYNPAYWYPQFGGYGGGLSGLMVSSSGAPGTQTYGGYSNNGVGTFGQGGSGQISGGGGGWYGGGGGGRNYTDASSAYYGYFGGGGGSGYIGGVTSGSMSTGVRAGNGYATISYNVLMCNQVVTNIIATDTSQTINKGGSIVTTATATYLDGSTGTVNCTSDFNPDIIGVQTVTLTYSGLVDNAKTTGSKTCTVQVTVKNPSVIIGITVNPNSQSLQRYTEPTFSVIATYDNNTSKEVTGYTISGFDSSVIGTQAVTISYTEDDITKTAVIYITVTHLTTTCPVCGAVYDLDDNDIDNGCPVCRGKIIEISASPDNIILSQGEALSLTVIATYADGHKEDVSGWTSNFDATVIGIQEVTVSYQGFSTYITVNVLNSSKACPYCQTIYSLNDDGTDPGCQICSKTVESISVTPEKVSIGIHQPLLITVTATYKDGHIATITDWTTDLTADTPGIYNASIFYQSLAKIIEVTVLEDGLLQCSYCGLKYKFEDSPKGCPECYYTLTGIEAALRNGGTTVPCKSKLNLQITEIFKDTHREIIYKGWTVEGYNPNILGVQTITVYYQGLSTSMTIEVVDDLPKTICPNGHEYYLNEDGTDPGCPYCEAEVDKNKALFYFDITYTSEILETIYTDGVYYMNKGDYLTVAVIPRNNIKQYNLKNMFYKTSQGITEKRYKYGGEVF